MVRSKADLLQCLISFILFHSVGYFLLTRIPKTIYFRLQDKYLQIVIYPRPVTEARIKNGLNCYADTVSLLSEKDL